MLTDSNIETLCKKMQIPLGAVCFKNEIPKVEPNKSYFVNMEDSVDETGQINPGTHWVMFQVCSYDDNKAPESIYFDPYGAPPPEAIKKAVEELTKQKNLPYTHKDIQSLMNNACGFYCLALAHFINSSQHRTNYLYKDVSTFMDLFDDLNESVDFKKNEYILKHFFRSSDPALRVPVEVLDKISDENNKDDNRPDLMKYPISLHVMKK